MLHIDTTRLLMGTIPSYSIICLDASLYFGKPNGLGSCYIWVRLQFYGRTNHFDIPHFPCTKVAIWRLQPAVRNTHMIIRSSSGCQASNTISLIKHPHCLVPM